MGKNKRVVAISDMHCGHIVGLTPPEWWLRPYPEIEAVQREMWNFYTSEIAALGHIDALLVLGDCIDGKAKKSGGTELLTSDLMAQIGIAEQAIRLVNADKVVMVHGTPYHTSADGEDMETVLAERLGATIGGHEWADCNGVVFDLKHKVGSSSIEHGRHTAIARARLANLLWADRELAPRANIIIRGHVHYYAGAYGDDWEGFTMPALQGPGSKFGVRQCEGLVHFGFVHIDISTGGDFSCTPHILKMVSAAPRVSAL